MKNVLPSRGLRRTNSPCTAPTISENKIAKYTGPGFMGRHYAVLPIEPHCITSRRASHPTEHVPTVCLERRSSHFLFVRFLFDCPCARASKLRRNSHRTL